MEDCKEENPASEQGDELGSWLEKLPEGKSIAEKQNNDFWLTSWSSGQS